MALIYTPKKFDPRELISPELYKLCGPDALYMYDPDILRGIDQLSMEFGGFICNTWFSPRMVRKYGLQRFRGLRAANQKIGAKRSAHKIGIKKIERIIRHGRVPYSAVDGTTPNVPISELHTHIKSREFFWGKYFKRIEAVKPNGKPITWFHGDSKPHRHGGIHFFKP